MHLHCREVLGSYILYLKSSRIPLTLIVNPMLYILSHISSPTVQYVVMNALMCLAKIVDNWWM